jgi:transcriptional regulator with XRE-family HTH domain
VPAQTSEEPRTAGELIRFWRTRRGLSQLELSLDANVSTKHLSFVETGRSSPSRQLLVHLAQHLDLPIAERNRLLLAGGFAPPYLELPYDGDVMQPLRESLGRLLEAHEPNPALIVDGLWNVIEANRAASLLWDGVDPELLGPPINVLRLGVHPGGLPRISSMTAACNAPLIHRLKRRSREDADPALARLVEEVESHLPDEPPAGPAIQPVVSLRLQTSLGDVELFTVIATLGAPLDVTAANLAIETFLPMNAESASRLVTRRPPSARGVRSRVPSWAWAMLLTIARPRPTPACSVRTRSVPRRNGSTSVEISCGASASPVFSTVSVTVCG